MVESEIYKEIVNSISAHVAIIDESGEILETNLAWKDFANENGMDKSFDSIGKNIYQHLFHSKLITLKADSFFRHMRNK